MSQPCYGFLLYLLLGYMQRNGESQETQMTTGSGEHPCLHTQPNLLDGHNHSRKEETPITTPSHCEMGNQMAKNT